MMITIPKLRSLINNRIKNYSPLSLVKYSLRTVSKSEDYGHTTLDIKYIEISEFIRGRGIGKKILSEIINVMFENEVDCIVITANELFGTEYHKLIKLYTSLGFIEIDGGVRGSMYMINPNSNDTSKSKAEKDIINASREQRLEQRIWNF